MVACSGGGISTGKGIFAGVIFPDSRKEWPESVYRGHAGTIFSFVDLMVRSNTGSIISEKIVKRKTDLDNFPMAMGISVHGR
jgi:hypothetical protein